MYASNGYFVDNTPPVDGHSSAQPKQRAHASCKALLHGTLLSAQQRDDGTSDTLHAGADAEENRLERVRVQACLARLACLVRVF